MTQKAKNVFVLIPAYNEEQSVGLVVRQVLLHTTIKKCIVVDDGSTDNTSREARKAGAYVIKKRKNGGSGQAIITGLAYIVKMNPQHVVLMDADGQHDPAFLDTLIQTIITTRADCVIASRYLKPGEHVTALSRRIGTKLIVALFWLFYGRLITDPTSGYRIVQAKVVQCMIDHPAVIFAEPETLITLIEKGFVIKEIPCQMKSRLYGSSSITTGKALYLMGYIFLTLIRRKWPWFYRIVA